jgi:tripartite ATP-independent transporter DctM subunit
MRIATRERLQSLRNIWPMLVLFALVIGTLYSGVVTVTESAGLGTGGAILLAGVFLGRKVFPALREALDRTVRTTAMIFTIIIGAFLFNYFLTLTGVTKDLLGAVAAMDVPPAAIVFAVLFIYIVLGCFMDQLAILVLTLPIVFPLMVQLHYDPIWLGIVVTKTVEIGLITPPFGMNCFVASQVSNTPLSQVFRGITPFIMAELVVLALLASIPQLITWVN